MPIKTPDACYGALCESVLYENIKNRFGDDVVKCTDEFVLYDFSNDAVFIELKSRRNAKDRYPDTMIGYNKIRFFLDHPEKKAYCVFKFTDGAFYIEVNEETVKQFRMSWGGRRDRGRDEFKKYCYIPVKLLLPLVEPSVAHPPLPAHTSTDHNN